MCDVRLRRVLFIISVPVSVNRSQRGPHTSEASCGAAPHSLHADKVLTVRATFDVIDVKSYSRGS